MKKADGRDGEREIPDLDEGDISVDEEKSHTAVQNCRPRDSEAGVEFAQVIPIDQRTPIPTFWIETHC